MEKFIRLSLIVLLASLLAYVGYYAYETYKSSLSEPEFSASVSGPERKETEKDCGCQEASNSNHHAKDETSRKLQGMTDIVVESYAERT